MVWPSWWLHSMQKLKWPWRIWRRPFRDFAKLKRKICMMMIDAILPLKIWREIILQYQYMGHWARLLGPEADTFLGKIHGRKSKLSSNNTLGYVENGWVFIYWRWVRSLLQGRPRRTQSCNCPLLPDLFGEPTYPNLPLRMVKALETSIINPKFNFIWKLCHMICHIFVLFGPQNKLMEIIHKSRYLIKRHCWFLIYHFILSFLRTIGGYVEVIFI